MRSGGRELSRIVSGREESRRRPRDTGSPPGVIPCRTTSVDTYPTAAGRVYMVRPDAYSGDEAEGATVTKTAISEPFPAVHIGATAPPQGTAVLVYRAGGRWVFDN